MRLKFTHFILSFFVVTVAVQAQNVGIGTNTPTEKLHVQGGARITSLSGLNIRLVQADASGVLSTIADGTAGQVLTTCLLYTSDAADE